MYIIPAIDLRHQQCVRLYQGDYNQQTVYANDPLAIVQQFERAGSQWVHIVDLDGAKDPEQHQRGLIQSICANTQLNVQTGGGIREIDQVEALLNVGVKRIIIGSLAVKNPKLIQEWIQSFGAEHFVLALDVNEVDNQFYIAIHGWQQKSVKTLFDFLDDFMANGLIHALCTDISRDGTLTGPNVTLYQQILKKYPQLQLQASGGIARLEDLIELKQNNLSACIIGRALYEGKFTLDEAIGSIQHAC